MWHKLIGRNGQRCGKYDVAWAMQGRGSWKQGAPVSCCKARERDVKV